MPILRYFIYVGGALLALLLVVGYTLPNAPEGQTEAAAKSEAPLIRIHSDRKLPDRVVLDTTQPMPAVQTAAVAAPQQPSQALAEMSAKAQVRESFAQLTPSAAKTEPVKTEVAAVKKTEAKPHRKIARSRPSAPYYGYGSPYYGRPMLMAQQPHYSPFNMTW
jgi:hypothetical protein